MGYYNMFCVTCLQGAVRFEQGTQLRIKVIFEALFG